MLEAPIQLLKPNLDKPRTSLFFPQESIRITSPTKTGWWGVYSKRIMTGELGSPRRKVSLVRKEVHRAAEYYNKWRFLKKNGIPTVESMRVTEGYTHVLMTDYTALHAQSYGKERRKHWDDLHKPKYINHEVNVLDSLFAEIPVSDIIAEIRRIEALASNCGILFPSDDPLDIFIFPDGSWKVLILDLSELQIIPLSEFDSVDCKTNSKLIQRFIDGIEYMHQNMVAPGLPSQVLG